MRMGGEVAINDERFQEEQISERGKEEDKEKEKRGSTGGKYQEQNY